MVLGGERVIVVCSERRIPEPNLWRSFKLLTVPPREEDDAIRRFLLVRGWPNTTERNLFLWIPIGTFFQATYEPTPLEGWLAFQRMLEGRG